jgi:hypothetical protein
MMVGGDAKVYRSQVFSDISVVFVRLIAVVPSSPQAKTLRTKEKLWVRVYVFCYASGRAS